jgi:potassium-transporting ATPase KdpC subunit
MLKIFVPLRVFVVYVILLGLIYPFFIWLIGNIIFPYQASGSLISHRGQVIGSKLIAQEFVGDKYFHSRYSSIYYDAANSGEDNLASSSKKLIEITKERIKKIRIKNKLSVNFSLPADMVLNSASGLDPHISLGNAKLQLQRVAERRGLSEDKVRALIFDNILADFIGIWGIWGNSVINVLTLNLALDKLDDKFKYGFNKEI